MNQQRVDTTTGRMTFSSVFPFIMLLVGAKNGARIMSILTQMTEGGFLNWTTVRESGNFAKITGTDADGTFSATITKVHGRFVSPLEIEISYAAQGFVKSKNEKIVLDPGNFTTLATEVWRRASDLFRPLHQLACRTALEADFRKRSKEMAN